MPEEGEGEYKVYRRRHAILAAVVILNISNACIWICYSIVATTAADYYDTETTKINWFSSCYMITAIFFSFISTYIVDRAGLRFGMYLGAGLNMVGSAIKAIGSSSLIEDKSAQYGVALFGQELTAMSQSFILFIPTKVSQTWYPESMRAIATTVMAMSNPLGIVVGVIITPLIVKDAEDIPTVDVVWMAFAIAAFIFTVVCVTRTKPKIAPSRSAEQSDITRPAYLPQLKSAFTTPAFLILMVVLGGGIGIFTAFATLAEQILCPLGYSTGLVGIAIALMVLFGLVGSAVTGIYVDRTKQFLEVTKVFFGLAAICYIILFEFCLIPEKEILLALFAGLAGFFGVGAYPVGLELAVEATYPVQEMISTAFIFLAGQMTAFVIVAVVPIAASPQDSSLSSLNECGSDVDPLNYTYPVMGMMAYLALIVSFMIAFMKTDYKRLNAEKHRQVGEKTKEDPIVEPLQNA